MGADGGAPSSGRGSMVSSDLPPLPKFLPLEPIILRGQRYPHSGELRRALGYPHGSSSDYHLLGTSHSKISTPVTNDGLKPYKDSVLDGSKKASERCKMFGDSICKLEKYKEAVGTRKRQRSDLMSGGSNSLRTGNQISGNVHDHSSHKLESKNKAMGTNKRARSSPTGIKVEVKSGMRMTSRDQVASEKPKDISRGAATSFQPEERMCRLSAVGEGWDKKVKRKRSVAVVANRGVDNDGKQTTPSKPTASDPRSTRINTNQSLSSHHPSKLVKAKISRESRAGAAILASSSDLHASSDMTEGWESPSSTNKVQSLSLMRGCQNGSKSLCSMAQWVGQRPQKMSRTRRTNVVSPVSNYSDANASSPISGPPAFGARKNSNGNSGGSSTSEDGDISTQKSRVKMDNTSLSNRLPDSKDVKELEHELKDKELPDSDAISNSNLKLHGAIFPTKKNRSLGDEDNKDGGWRQEKVGRAIPLSKPSTLQKVETPNNIATKPLENIKASNDKNRSKTGRPPLRKLAERKAFARAAESDNDREELLAAAASARKSSYLACVGRFWKKMEPIFCSVGSEDSIFLEQQLESADKLEESLARMSGADGNVLRLLMENVEACSSQVSQKDDSFSGGFDAAVRSEKASSLYQRVLSALIEEDESEGICNGGEVISTSFQCASDDSHCGSCNYNNDIEMRDRDRLESEAESRVDVHFQKHCAGDRFSCSRSVASNASKNISMSDSLHSSGRWQGDEGFSHSDVEFGSGICQSDTIGSQLGDVNVSGSVVSDSQYQLMCVDDKLVLELQSIGLYLENMPDLAEEEELASQDIMELKEGLSQKIVKKKTGMVKVDKAIQDDKEREKLYLEQAAMNQLVQMAYRRRMACRKTTGARTMTRKVSRQVAMGFVDRTLARCRKFEITGRSCFREPSLQNVLFSAPQACEPKSSDVPDLETLNSSAAPKQKPKGWRLSGPDSNTTSRLESSIVDNHGRGILGSPLADSHESEFGSSKDDISLQKGRKRELLLDDVGGGLPSRKPTLPPGATGKRSERERFIINRPCELMPFSLTRGKPKAKAELNQTKSAILYSNIEYNVPSGGAPALLQTSAFGKAQGSKINESGTDGAMVGPGNKNHQSAEDLEEPIDFSKMPQPEFECLEQLGGPQDLTSWFDDDGLQDYDSIGLEIPMDDISDLNMML